MTEIADKLATALRLAYDDLVWMSGSTDFAPGMAAHKEWLNVRARMKVGDEALAAYDAEQAKAGTAGDKEQASALLDKAADAITRLRAQNKQLQQLVDIPGQHALERECVTLRTRVAELEDMLNASITETNRVRTAAFRIAKLERENERLRESLTFVGFTNEEIIALLKEPSNG